MKIVAISDQHGTLPKVPPCDLLLIGGDICPTANHQIWFQESWLSIDFRRWLKTVPAKRIIGIAGNHDYIFQNAPQKVPTLPWTYLQDSSTEFEGLKIYGSPWQPYFHDWAFNLYEEDLLAKWAAIPDDTDILVVHGPPYGHGDKVPGRHKGERIGSPGLLKRIEKIKPKLVVCGHCHEGHGIYHVGETIVANVSILDGGYKFTNNLTLLDIPASNRT